MDLSRELQWWPPRGTIDLSTGQLGCNLLPVEALADAARAQSTQPARGLLYGSQHGPERLRQQVARFIKSLEEYTPDLATLMITAGSSSALDEICTVFTRPGDRVLVGELTYDRALRIFHDHRLKVTRIPGSGAHLDLDALHAALAKPDGPTAFIYITPTFHNPSGDCATRAWRADFASLIATRRVTVVEDDAYRELHYAEPPAPSVRSFTVGKVIRLGTFSKTLAPGLRVGWLEADKRVVRALSGRGSRVSGGGSSQYAANLVAELIASGGYELHLSRVRRELQQRAGALDGALRAHPEAGWVWNRPTGGYFFLLEAKGTSRLTRAFRAVGVRVAPGSNFGNSGPRSLARIALSFSGSETLEDAIERVSSLIVAES